MPAPSRIRLTLGRVESFSCAVGKPQAFLWDTDAPGLAVRATPPGKRSSKGGSAYIFQGYLAGKSLRLTIGDIKVWTLEASRVEARRLQALLDQGIDPRELAQEKAQAKAVAAATIKAAKLEAERKQQYTLRALCEAYTELLRAKGKADSARQASSILKCHVFEAHPDVASLPASAITAHQVAMMVRKVIEQGKERTAGVLRSYLLAAFNAARKAPFDAKLPGVFIEFGIESNPADPIATIPVKRGERALNADELRRYMADLGDSQADMALKLTLYSGGQRMAQLLRAKVSDYDEQTQTLRLWDGKGKRQQPREHLLPLAPQAAAMVETLIAHAERMAKSTGMNAGNGNTPAHSDLLLFSSNGRTPMVATTPGKRVAEISKNMGGAPFDLRDLRRTCETMLAALRISKDDRAQLLSHGISGVQAAHYDRHEYADEKRAALIAWEQRLSDISKGISSAKVVPMSKRRKTAA